MENINTRAMGIIDDIVPVDDYIAQWDAFSQEEKNRRIEQLDESRKIREEEWRIEDAKQLRDNLNILQDLLDFETYRALRFELEERPSFSLEFIITLVQIYKSNNYTRIKTEKNKIKEWNLRIKHAKSKN